MADVRKNIDIVFNGVDKFSDKTKNIGASLTNLSSPIASATKSVLKVEAAAAFAAAALGGLSLKLAGDFQVGMKSIGTLSDATGKQMSGLSNDILKFASSSTTSLGELQKSTFDAQSAGIKFADSIYALQSAEKLGVAGHTDNATAMKLLTNTMNGMDLQAGDLGSISDTLFATMQGGVTTIAEMSSTFALITPSAKAAGFSLNEVGAAFSTVTAVTGNSSIAATQLKALFNELTKPTTTLSKALKSVGVDAQSASFQSKDLAGKMELLLKATGGSAEKTKLLFSSLEAGSAAFIIAQGDMAKYNAELDRQANKNGLVEKSYKSLINTLDNQTKIAVNAATVSLTQFGKPMLESFTNVASGVKAIFQSLGVSISAGALADITDQINVWANALASNLDGIAAALPAAFNQVDFAPMLDALNSVGSSLGSVFNGLDLTKPQDLAKAMNEVIKFMGGLVEATAGVFSVLADLAVFILDTAKAWGSLDSSMQKAIGIIGGIAIAIGTVAPAISIMSKALGLGSTGLETMAKSSSKLISSLGKAGLIGAYAAAGFAAGTFIEQALIPDSWKKDMQDAIGWLDRISGGLITSKDAAAAYAEANKNIAPTDAQTKAIITTADAILSSANSMRKQMDAATQAGISDADYAAALDKVSTNALKASDSTKIATASTRKATQVLVGYATAADGTKTAIYQTATALDSNTAAQDKNIKKTNEALSATQKMQLKYKEIAAQTSVKIFEIKAKVDIAKLGEVTKRVQAAFNSVDNTIAGTGSLILGLFDKIGTKGGANDNSILSAIHNAQRERTNAIALRRQLVQTQIRASEAIITQGNTPVEIIVHGNDMEIELEAFMWKILDRISIRASADRLEYLKGLSTGTPPK